MDMAYWKNTLTYLKKRKNTAQNPQLYEQLLNKLSK